MRVTLEGEKLSLETDLFVGDDVTTVHDGYTINGQETNFPARLQSGPTATGKRTAKWNAEGTGFEVNETASFTTPEGNVLITMQRKWMLAADGKTLVIELHHTGQKWADSDETHLLSQVKASRKSGFERVLQTVPLGG